MVKRTRRIGTRDGGNVFSEHDRQTKDEMPINMAMHDPRASIIGTEPDGDVVACTSEADNIALNGVGEVVGAAAGTPDDAEGMAVQVNGVLRGD
jgi:hypothetical protein